MNKTIKLSFQIILIFIILYLLISFHELSLNPFQWPQGARFAQVMFSATGGIILIMLDSIDNPKN